MLMNTRSIIRYESWERARQGSPPHFTSRLRLNVAENLAAAFDLDLAVADRPRDPAGRLDQEPVADDQITSLGTQLSVSTVSSSASIEISENLVVCSPVGMSAVNPNVDCAPPVIRY